MASKYIKGITISIGADTQKLTKALEGVNKQSRELQGELRQVERLLKLDPTNTELLEQKQKLLAKSIETTKEKLDTLKEAERQVQAQFEKGEIGEEQYRAIQREVITTEQNLQKLEQRLKETNNHWKTTAENLDKFGKKATDVGKSMTTKITLPILGAGAAAVKVGADFEAAMSEVQAISGATEDDLAALEEKAKEMGATTKFSASEAAEALKYMAMAGWDTQQMLDGLEGVMNLAAASGEDLATVSDIVTDAITAFGMQANESAKFADLLAKTSSSANTNVSMLGESFKYVAPVFGSLGYSAEDAALALGLMANSGIKASQAGTTLRSAITKLTKPTDDAATLLEKLNITITDAEGNMLPFRDVMNQLRNSFSNLTAEQQAQCAATIFGQEAMSGMLAIINASEQDYQKLANAVGNYNGAAKKMADTMQNNLQGQLTILKSQLEGVAIQISEVLIPIISKIVEKISKWVSWFAGLDKSTQKIILTVTGLVAAIGPLLIVVGKIATGISSIIALFGGFTAASGAAAAAAGGLGAALAALTGPVGIAVAAIAGIAAITALVIKNWDKVKEFFAGLGDWFKNTFTNIANSMVQFGKNIIQGLYNGIMSNVKSIYNSITSIGNTIINTFKRLLGISSPSKVMQEYGEYIDEGLVKGMKMGEGSVKDQVQRLADGIKQTMEKNINMLDKFGNALVDALRKQYEEMEDIQLKALDKQIENERKASNERIAIYDKEYAEKLKLIDEEAYKQIQALQEQIDAIDRQTEEEEKALREQEHQARVAELQKQLAAAETAEERQRIQGELNETIADYERELLLEQREEMREQLRAQIEEIRNAAEEKKTALKEELEAKKETEQQKLEEAVSSLEDEKAAIREHYEELMKEENLQAEARKLIIEKNNDEIIRLLETYNPKWQDAGQSFGESLIYGLNSEKQSMEETVAEMLNLEPTINKQIQALDKLEQKLATLGDSSSSGGGGDLSNLQIPAIKETTEDLKNLEQAADGASKSINNIITNLDNSYNAVNLFGNGISENTQKAVSGFLELDNQATITLNTLSWSGQTITAETKDAIVNNFAQMKDQVITELDTQKENGLAILGEFLAGSENISEEERQTLLQNVSEGYEERKQKIEENEARIKEILTTASNEKRALTREEKEEINRLQDEMRNEGIRILSENEVEAKIILERMKAQSGEITARQAAEVVQNSLYQKDEAIKAAEEQYDNVIAEIIKQRDEVGSISAEQADELIKEAKRQRDEAIAKAEEMHNKVVEEAKKQAGEHANEVDWETGEILSKWDIFKRNVGQKVTEIKENAIETWQNMWNEIKNKVENAWEYMSDAFSGLWDNISGWFEDLIDDAFDWGKNLIDGFIDGIKSMINKVKNAVTSVVNIVSDYLGFHSPAKKGEGRYIVDWGQNMIEGFMEGMQKAIPDLQTSVSAITPAIKNEIITPEIDYSKIPASSRNTEVHLHVGILIADDYGLKQLERRLRDIRISENARLGEV